MGYLTHLRPTGVDSAKNAARVLLERAEVLGLGTNPWSVAELALDPTDYAWLITWGRGLSSVEAHFLTNGNTKLEVTLVFFAFVVAVARTKSEQGEIWPEVISRTSNAFRSTLMPPRTNGYPVPELLSSLRAAIEHYNLRNVITADDRQRYYTTIQLQIGFTRLGAQQSLPQWLRLQNTPTAVSMLLNPDSPAFSDSFRFIWSLLRAVAQGAVTRERAGAILRTDTSGWIETDSLDLLLDAASRQPNGNNQDTLTFDFAAETGGEIPWLSGPRCFISQSGERKVQFQVIPAGFLHIPGERWEIRHNGTPVASCIIDNGSFVSTPKEISLPWTRFDYRFELSEAGKTDSLSSMLCSISGVDDGWIFIDEKSGRVLDSSKPQRSSSFLLITRDRLRIRPQTTPNGTFVIEGQQWLWWVLQKEWAQQGQVCYPDDSIAWEPPSRFSFPELQIDLEGNEKLPGRQVRIQVRRLPQTHILIKATIGANVLQKEERQNVLDLGPVILTDKMLLDGIPLQLTLQSGAEKRTKTLRILTEPDSHLAWRDGEVFVPGSDVELALSKREVLELLVRSNAARDLRIVQASSHSTVPTKRNPIPTVGWGAPLQLRNTLFNSTDNDCSTLARSLWISGLPMHARWDSSVHTLVIQCPTLTASHANRPHWNLWVPERGVLQCEQRHVRFIDGRFHITGLEHKPAAVTLSAMATNMYDDPEWLGTAIVTDVPIYSCMVESFQRQPMFSIHLFRLFRLPFFDDRVQSRIRLSRGSLHELVLTATQPLLSLPGAFNLSDSHSAGWQANVRRSLHIALTECLLDSTFGAEVFQSISCVDTESTPLELLNLLADLHPCLAILAIRGKVQAMRDQSHRHQFETVVSSLAAPEEHWGLLRSDRSFPYCDPTFLKSLIEIARKLLSQELTEHRDRDNLLMAIGSKQFRQVLLEKLLNIELCGGAACRM